MQNSSSPVLCCITAQSSCMNIIVKGKALAEQLDVPLKVVSVQPTKCDARRRADDMICLDRLSKDSHTEIDVLYSDDPLLALAEYIKDLIPVHIFTGKQAEKGSFVMTLAEACELPVTMVYGDTEITVSM